MALELYMVGLVTKDMEKSLEFYRRLGLALSEGNERHVKEKMESGVTFFLNAPGRTEVADSERVIFEFYLPSRAAVEQKHAELTSFGYQSSRAPAFEPAITVYFALVSDPDGHTIMLSAD
ncbi:MAG: VOC family protein [Ktedonobacteraceae bacterium]|nr:VOC family protein [Ktedonobacteraceae bacterium]